MDGDAGGALLTAPPLGGVFTANSKPSVMAEYDCTLESSDKEDKSLASKLPSVSLAASKANVMKIIVLNMYVKLYNARRRRESREMNDVSFQCKYVQIHESSNAA